MTLCFQKKVMSNNIGRGYTLPFLINVYMKSTDKYIEDVKKIHGNKYDYSKVKYCGYYEYITIICPKHGEFKQRASTHIQGSGCPKCGTEIKRSPHPKKSNTSEFIKKSKEIHCNKYDYSKAEYLNRDTKVCIICPEHGEFWQTPSKHLTGQGCKECGKTRTINSILNTTEDFIERIRSIYGDKYDYSKVDYVKAKVKVCLICKTHGEFWARPDHLLNGHGCRKCRESGIEREMRMTLNEQNINNIQEYRNSTIFDKQSLDFYLPDYNIAIECQGEQHFKDNFYKNKSNSDSKKYLLYVQELDKRKKKLCKENNIHLIYYVPKIFTEYMDKEDIFFTNVNDIIKYIKNKGNLS